MKPMTSYKKIKSLFNARERRHILYLLLGTIVMSLLEVVGIASIVPFMAIVSKPEIIHENIYLNFSYQYFGFTSDNQFLMASGVLALIVLSFSNCYNAFMTWRMNSFGNMQGHRLAMRLLSNYLSQPYLFFLNRNTAELGKNVLAEVDRIIQGIVVPSMQAISKLVLVIFIFVFLVLVDPFLAVSVALAMSGAYLVLIKCVRSRLHNLGVATTEAISQRFKIANEALSWIKDIKLRGSEMELLRRFSIPSEANAKYSVQNLLIAQLPRHAFEIVAFGGILLIVIYLISKNLNSEQVVSVMMLYALAGYRVMPAFQQIYLGISSVRYHFPVLEIICKDLSNVSAQKLLQSHETSVVTFEKSVRLESIRFFYPNVGTPVIKALDLNIDYNTTVGFVGGSGSGKTTLVDLLLGLLSPESGNIIVDGVKITQENLSAWQNNLAYVPQSIYLSDDTIERNIAFAIPDKEINHEQVIKAAKLAELDGFVETLGDRYQTSVGERGVRLSGGQRQRIGIARALYFNPKLLVLDEATSALDGITEKVVMDAIHNLSHKITIVVIAHRLTTVRECDVIHLIDNGKIVDSGSYDELIRRNTQFQKMAQA